MKSSRTSGWNSDLPTFRETRARVIRTTIQEFVQDASLEQVQAWDESIPLLQREAGELVEADEGARRYVAILEYQLPMESRRPDAVLLAGGTVVVIELKGKARATQADVDQAAAYARDLRAYHRECHERPVHAVLVPTNAGSEVHRREGVYIVGPEGLDLLTREIVRAESGETALSPGAFLDIDAYRPLPTLVRAARELFESRTVREIWKARSATEPTVHAISEVTRDAARTKT